MIEITSTHTFADLSLADLPGPDTTTKRSAAETSDPRLMLMLLEAARTSWPEAYSDDLYLHDAKTLFEHPGETMLWILREHGTHLYPLQSDNEHEASYYRRVINYWSGEHKLNMAEKPSDKARYYLVNDSVLKEISAEEAARRIKTRTS